MTAQRSLPGQKWDLMRHIGPSTATLVGGGWGGAWEETILPMSGLRVGCGCVHTVPPCCLRARVSVDALLLHRPTMRVLHGVGVAASADLAFSTA